MKNTFLLFIVLIGLTKIGASQTVITWEVCKDVKFNEVWSEEFQAYYMVPKFGKKIFNPFLWDSLIQLYILV